MDIEVVESCRRAVETGRLDRGDCIRMFGYDADSEESRFIIDNADLVMRERNGNSCSIGVQIGVITGPCIADCGFCGFAISTTRADDYVMPSHVLREYLEHVTAHDDVESVSLMTIHNFDFDDLMELVDTACRELTGEHGEDLLSSIGLTAADCRWGDTVPAAVTAVMSAVGVGA